MKKIVFGITCLELGGAERVLIDIVNNLVDKYDITIFTLYGKGDFLGQLNDRVKVESMYNCKYDDLNKLEKLKMSLKMYNGALRKLLYDKYIRGRYDVEIAFLEGPMTWIFSTPSNTKKIAWVHNDIEKVFGEGKRAQLKKSLNVKAYNGYNKIVFVSKDNLDIFNSIYPNNKVDKLIIKNYIDKDIVLKRAKEKIDKLDHNVPCFVQVSRLVSQKGLYRLLDVHRELIDEGYEHKIYIVGDGPLKSDLQKLITEYNLLDSFILLGQKENPYPYIKDADYFILTSLYEGYGMVVLEAEILGKYIMITDTAAREALDGYEYGMVVNNNFDGVFDGMKEIIKKKPKVSKKIVIDNESILKNIIELIEG